MNNFENLKIAVAGTGYVGLSMATLLSQKHQVTAVDVIPEKVEKINNRVSPIQDEYIEKFFAEKELNLRLLSMVVRHIRMQTSSSLQPLPTMTLSRTSSTHIISRM